MIGSLNLLQVAFTEKMCCRAGFDLYSSVTARPNVLWHRRGPEVTPHEGNTDEPCVGQKTQIVYVIHTKTHQGCLIVESADLHYH